MITGSDNFTARRLQVSRYSAALAHPARVSILEKLAEQGRATCGEITEQLPLAQPTVSQHLKKLLDAGFIHCEKDGLKSIYSLNGESVQLFRALSFELLNKLSNPMG